MSGQLMRRSLTPADVASLREARLLLESESFIARVTSVLGTPIETGMKRLPPGFRTRILSIAEASLERALRVATWSMKEGLHPASKRRHKAMVAVTGGVGGAFGMPALAVELPTSTTIMLRSIADIARSEGESLVSSEAQLACLSVFAMDGPSSTDDSADCGYFALRTALATSVTEATTYLASHGATRATPPALVRLIGHVAARFSIPVTQKTAAQAVPLIGGLAGATINTMFMDHFQGLATGHFTVRRLERVYGPEAVQAAYLSFPAHETDN